MAGVKLTPLGSVPLTLRVGAGVPVAVTWNAPALPTLNVVASAEVMLETSRTSRLTGRLAALPMPFAAPRVTAYVPLVPASGVPEMAPVAESKERPAGKLPSRLNVGTGKPPVVIVYVPGVPMVKVAVAAPLKLDASWMVSVMSCRASGGTPLLTSTPSTCSPPVPAAGVPWSWAVATLKLTPAGRVPLRLNELSGLPVASSWNEPTSPTVKVTLSVDVISGDSSTSSVRSSTTSAPMPFAAVSSSR